MTAKLKWVPYSGEPLMRQQIDPSAREGYKPVTLAWVRKHAHVSHYQVRWWEGATDSEGRWHTHDFPADASLGDVKRYAQTIATNVSSWEVEIYLRGRTHGNTGWEYYARVWEFGHYVRDDLASRQLRGEPSEDS